jgi:hypothetical protein
MKRDGKAKHAITQHPGLRGRFPAEWLAGIATLCDTGTRCCELQESPAALAALAALQRAYVAAMAAQAARDARATALRGPELPFKVHRAAILEAVGLFVKAMEPLVVAEIARIQAARLAAGDDPPESQTRPRHGAGAETTAVARVA